MNSSSLIRTKFNGQIATKSAEIMSEEEFKKNKKKYQRFYYTTSFFHLIATLF